jgi:hypothetical protein
MGTVGISYWLVAKGVREVFAESKSSKAWDLSAIGGRAFARVQEGVDVSSVVAGALFQRQPDERRILSELGKASQLFVPYERGKENASMHDLSGVLRFRSEMR